MPLASRRRHVLRNLRSGWLLLLNFWLRLLWLISVHLTCWRWLLCFDVLDVLRPVAARIALLFEHGVMLLLLVVDRDDSELGALVRATSVRIRHDVLLRLIIEQLLLFLVGIWRDQAPDLLLLMEDVAERVFLGAATAEAASTLLVSCRVVRVAQFLKFVTHSSLPIVFRLLVAVADNRRPDLVDVVVTIAFCEHGLGAEVFLAEDFGLALALSLEKLELGLLFGLNAAWVVILFNLHLKLLLLLDADFVAALKVTHLILLI